MLSILGAPHRRINFHRKTALHFLLSGVRKTSWARGLEMYQNCRRLMLERMRAPVEIFYDFVEKVREECPSARQSKLRVGMLEGRNVLFAITVRNTYL